MDALTAVAGMLVIITLVGMALSWPIMLLWGAIAGTLGLPTLGYGTVLQVTILARLLIPTSGGS